MKILKWFVITILSLIALFLLIAVFLPSEYNVERKATIYAPVDVVYGQVVDFRKWEHWSPWKSQDLDAVYTFSEPSAGAGARMDWSGDTAETGSLTTVETTPPVSIHNKLAFGSEEEMFADTYWTFEQAGDKTRVSWRMEGDLSNLVYRWFGLMMDGALGSDMEKGLTNLKIYSESLPKPVADSTEIEEPMMSGGAAAGGGMQ